jgi:hypothetical protein
MFFLLSFLKLKKEGIFSLPFYKDYNAVLAFFCKKDIPFLTAKPIPQTDRPTGTTIVKIATTVGTILAAKPSTIAVISGVKRLIIPPPYIENFINERNMGLNINRQSINTM